SSAESGVNTIETSALANMILSLDPAARAAFIRALNYNQDLNGINDLTPQARALRDIIIQVKAARLIESDETGEINEVLLKTINGALPEGKEITSDLLENLDLDKARKSLEEKGSIDEALIILAEIRQNSSNKLSEHISILKELLKEYKNIIESAARGKTGSKLELPEVAAEADAKGLKGIKRAVFVGRKEFEKSLLPGFVDMHYGEEGPSESDKNSDAYKARVKGDKIIKAATRIATALCFGHMTKFVKAVNITAHAIYNLINSDAKLELQEIRRTEAAEISSIIGLPADREEKLKFSQEEEIYLEIKKIFESLLSSPDLTGNISFIITHDPDVNAYIKQNGNSATLVLKYGLLKEMSSYFEKNGKKLSREHIAAVLAHELGHFQQQNSSRASRNREYDADKRALKIMDDAGYNPKAIIDLMQFFVFVGGHRYSYGKTHPDSQGRKVEVEKNLFDKNNDTHYESINNQQRTFGNGVIAETSLEKFVEGIQNLDEIFDREEHIGAVFLYFRQFGKTEAFSPEDRMAFYNRYVRSKFEGLSDEQYNVLVKCIFQGLERKIFRTIALDMDINEEDWLTLKYFAWAKPEYLESILNEYTFSHIDFISDTNRFFMLAAVCAKYGSSDIYLPNRFEALEFNKREDLLEILGEDIVNVVVNIGKFLIDWNDRPETYYYLLKYAYEHYKDKMISKFRLSQKEVLGYLVRRIKDKNGDGYQDRLAFMSAFINDCLAFQLANINTRGDIKETINDLGRIIHDFSEIITDENWNAFRASVENYYQKDSDYDTKNALLLRTVPEKHLNDVLKATHSRPVFHNVAGEDARSEAVNRYYADNFDKLTQDAQKIVISGCDNIAAIDIGMKIYEQYKGNTAEKIEQLKFLWRHCGEPKVAGLYFSAVFQNRDGNEMNILEGFLRDNADLRLYAQKTSFNEFLEQFRQYLSTREIEFLNANFAQSPWLSNLAYQYFIEKYPIFLDLERRIKDGQDEEEIAVWFANENIQIDESDYLLLRNLDRELLIKFSLILFYSGKSSRFTSKFFADALFFAAMNRKGKASILKYKYRGKDFLPFVIGLIFSPDSELLQIDSLFDAKERVSKKNDNERPTYPGFDDVGSIDPYKLDFKPYLNQGRKSQSFRDKIGGFFIGLIKSLLINKLKNLAKEYKSLNITPEILWRIIRHKLNIRTADYADTPLPIIAYLRYFDGNLDESQNLYTQDLRLGDKTKTAAGKIGARIKEGYESPDIIFRDSVLRKSSP
ncbi:MAG: M48 family metallopeptidase, partial [Eubacterium sp.]|nr:M48 family metallopeptidase [Eubacterium sp.]